MQDLRKAVNRFATEQEARSSKFMAINKKIDEISRKYNLVDHSDINRQRYPWAKGLLRKPEFYAARLWEYPYSVLSAQLNSGMKCLDVGCGMNAFLPYLRDIEKCDAIGLDPDFFESGLHNKAHGINNNFIKKTGLMIVESSMENIPLPTSAFDRIFCISVIEHVDSEVARKGMHEMARLLKPGGKLIITVDVNIFQEINKPLDLIWESGLLLEGKLDLRWPYKRFGIFVGGKEPADVFGFTLVKDNYLVQLKYTEKKNVKSVPGYQIPRLRYETTIPQTVSRDEHIDIMQKSRRKINKILYRLFKITRLK